MNDVNPTYVGGDNWHKLTETQWLRWRVQCLEKALADVAMWVAAAELADGSHPAGPSPAEGGV